MAGACDDRFAAVEDAFRENFAERIEVGAAVAVVISGGVVVDLWAGDRFAGGPSWERDTMVETRSAVKGVAALCLHLLIDRGLVDVDDSVRRFWPELVADPTVGQALEHTAGVPVIDGPLPPNALVDWQLMADAIAAQRPEWEPGERCGYHGVTFGWLVGQVVRAVSGKSVGGFLRDEIVGPLDADYFIGTPPSDHCRIAPMVAAPARDDGGRSTAAPTLPAASDPNSLAARMYAPMSPRWNSPEFWSAEIPVANGIGTARGLAAIYGDVARRDSQLFSRDAVSTMAALRFDGVDAVLGIPIRRTYGFELRPSWALDSRPDSAFGHPGASGFLAFADPEAELGVAYVKNAGWGGEPGKDPRASRLVDAVYASL